MTDITKCNDKECPLKDTCYRFTAPADEYQSYFIESPREGDGCECYWETKNIKVIKKGKTETIDEYALREMLSPGAGGWMKYCKDNEGSGKSVSELLKEYQNKTK